MPSLGAGQPAAISGMTLIADLTNALWEVFVLLQENIRRTTEPLSSFAIGQMRSYELYPNSEAI